MVEQWGWVDKRTGKRIGGEPVATREQAEYLLAHWRAMDWRETQAVWRHVAVVPVALADGDDT